MSILKKKDAEDGRQVIKREDKRKDKCEKHE